MAFDPNKIRLYVEEAIERWEPRIILKGVSVEPDPVRGLVEIKIVYQPNPMDGNIAEPLLTLACLDCSLSMQPVWKNFPSVILTSGTISPIELYPKILNFKPVTLRSIDI